MELRHSCPACGSDRHGRPRVRLAGGRAADVSVAHAGGLTLVGVADTGRLGVDLEPGAAEAPPALRHPRDDPDADPLALWVRKEAYLKATGDGLRRDPASVAPDEAGATWGVLDIPGHTAAWCLLYPDAVPGPGPVRGQAGSGRASSHADSSGSGSAGA